LFYCKECKEVDFLRRKTIDGGRHSEENAFCRRLSIWLPDTIGVELEEYGTGDKQTSKVRASQEHRAAGVN
jgi:hypothetical protein